MAKVDLSLLDRYVKDRLITKQQHPSANLLIFNYTPFCQYGRNWDEVTLMCRGLITDLEGNIVARPFKKFFNLEEHQGEVPDEPFTVHEKLDGSLGILYWSRNMPYLATRGSFASEQALAGTEILLEKYGEVLSHLSPAQTYLFEIIYPQNRIVVDYKGKRDVVMLAKIDTETGEERPIQPYNDRFSIAKRYDGVNDLAALKELENSDDEGFVLTFASGLKLKVKFQEYVRLHRLLTQVSSKSIWEVLKEGGSLNEIIDRVPDEFYQWVKATAANLRSLHDGYILEAQLAYERAKDLPTRREMAAALSVEEKTTRSIVFALLDNRSELAREIAWKAIKPNYEKPFKQDVDV